MKYVAARGSRLSDEQAQSYGEHFEMLIEQGNGELTPDVVLRDAEELGSPTHEFFVWSDSEAARRYRLGQAGYLLRSIHVVVSTSDDETIETRAFLHVQVKIEASDGEAEDGRDDETRGVFVTVADAMSSAEMRAQVIAEALRQLVHWRERYKQYTELKQLFGVIDSMEEQLALMEAA